MILKFIKFCVVGGSGALIDFGITYLCKEKLNLHRYAANTLGFCIAASSNYAINRYWTFESTNPILREFGLFVIFALVGLGINTLFVYLFERAKVNFYIAKFFAIVITSLWNFFVNYFYNF